MVYTQHGIGNYIRSFIEHPRVKPSRYSIVCEISGLGVVGFADFSVQSCKAFLSYICVHANARRQGVARRLIEAIEQEYGGVENVTLDVFADNEEAINFYRSLNFSVSGILHWHRRCLPCGRASNSLVVQNLPFAIAAYERYGFCELLVDFKASERRIGRIGRDLIRCFDQQDYMSDDLLASLASGFQEAAEALYISPPDKTDLASLPGENFKTSLRLTRLTVR